MATTELPSAKALTKICSNNLKATLQNTDNTWIICTRLETLKYRHPLPHNHEFGICIFTDPGGALQHVPYSLPLQQWKHEFFLLRRHILA